MRNLILIFSALLVLVLMTACGSGFETIQHAGPVNCSVSKVGNVATVTCPDGSQTTIQDGQTGPQGQTGATGQTGQTGQAGQNGQNGHSAAFSQGVADSSLCQNGGTVISLGVDLNDNGKLDPNEVTQIATVCNGLNGQNGANGTNGHDAPPSPFNIVSLLAPCAADPMHPTASELSNPDLEIFEKLQNGTILDSFSENISGYDTHFGVLSPGTYESTGAGNCIFSVDSAGIISRH